MSVEQARQVADAVLYEGYLLYPYRASATKNQLRWQFGVLMPPGFPEENSSCVTQLLVEPSLHTVLHLRVRFLQVQARTVLVNGVETPSAVVDGTEWTSWDEAVQQEVDAVLRFADLLAGDNTVPFTVDGGVEREQVSTEVCVVRRRWPLSGSIELRADALPGPYGASRLSVTVANVSGWAGSSRDEALRHALIAAHTVMSVSPGRFVSMVDPPEWAKPAVRECRCERTWPVLVGDAATALSSPIILYDYPSIAPESAGELFDGLEIDEILTLRTMALTDEEKREVRATDPRAAAIVDRVDAMPPELLDRLHGAIRSLTPARSVTPVEPSVVVAGVRVAKGSRVRLKPGIRRADAQDMFLAGRSATVQAVLHDIDGDLHLAVAVDDDLDPDYGRFRYFSAEEVEPL
ncbi:hypothetical protein [Kutzneria sp. CA-103260]|uniref:hypothetical protein n=1 Tax=Kutzneria sp. CA-103260 TaxID=2802641 RepID=UPI001BAACC62|nr:hypothetical protein [Kutzneria sp. CA-103260]QUQ64944.1 hypothetical protein JJ691_26650 [Kutzneria sp. CA-103260]